MDIKFLKKKKKFIKRNIEKKIDFFWKSILCIMFILIISSFVFGLYLFLKTNEELILLVEKNDTQELVKKEDINSVLDYFKEREKKSVEILNSPSPIVDPSL
ncbi:MAG: hypothetical protein UR25_C0003G0111 [Candidatus Nomurabacteria bacterium GW2011_GWE1_32_28]|uniref:Uncharacterized protein n=1 Tax=Candidatus Nomurabacteria bacterium GW2011_GWF1_31_48 TaxID=1618767 RepID=A0A0F9YFY4_9BACT|nr:MAG: hypothetical protein UR10_C0003G0111 [Candidatus Nomurabacteria bacterium GW2011_GWF2_30_133]KKP28751.1 MAG: hypothetical protein UR18_C0002G0163 [Candidatus Nomurabacteria bacterium GW2011_GWE2_31_40]KKP30328.1 MAG: hypothetical protein UR19_C0003G0164 [Candidatus Nomurabacteria bacterium GW2011_GWF1_31_48]KKP34855.1 MAG: hypothetical protein UR25_C0003G0111 [Candidatus Nomurabacteria bacterium GW2011_GWE1_32_28]HAS80949.1 hypothetical protein [Candidatus Nomurabacteria bacterium]